MIRGGIRFDTSDVPWRAVGSSFNQTGQWSYLFAATINLARRPKHPDYLVVMQKVPYTAQGHGHDKVEDAIADVLGP